MSVRWLVITAAVMALGVGGASAQGTDADLTAGIRHVDEGDFEAALVPLGRAVRTLSGDASRSKELAQAHLYLGIAYVMLDQEKAGRASFREALALDKDLRLSPEEFPRKVLRAYAAAVQDATSQTVEERPEVPAPGTRGPFSPAPQVYVSGQVAQPGGYSYKPGMTVLQAVTLAGGVTTRGSTLRIKIVRYVGGKQQEIKAKMTDLVQAEDTLVVQERFF